MGIADQPTDRKRFQILMVVMIVLGLIKFVSISVLSVLLGIAICLLALFGIWGSFMNHKKALFLVRTLFDCVFGDVITRSRPAAALAPRRLADFLGLSLSTHARPHARARQCRHV